jgi:16S rRNA (guanine966-N2)-methyltransferase
MRIISGEFKGFKLYETLEKNTRPLKDMVRESIFNFLNHSNKISILIEKAKILDLYSGTGSFGLECLSRQAQEVFFVEKDKNAIKALEKNIEKLKVKNKIHILSNDVLNVIKNYNNILFSQLLNKKFDLIFCDPPFKDENINNLIKLIISKNLLKKNGIIIVHRNKNKQDKFIKNIKIVDERIYGISKIIIFQL